MTAPWYPATPASQATDWNSPTPGHQRQFFHLMIDGVMTTVEFVGRWHPATGKIGKPNYVLAGVAQDGAIVPVDADPTVT